MKVELRKGKKCKDKTNLEVVGESHVPCSKIPTSLLQKQEIISPGIFRKVTFVWSMQASIVNMKERRALCSNCISHVGIKRHNYKTALSCQLLQGCKLSG